MNLIKRAAVIAGAYFAIAVVWIVSSGRIASALARSVEELERLERLKGIAFITVSGAGLFLAALVVLRKQQADVDEAARAREALLKSERNALAGLFVSSIAHDANNLTMVVASSLDLLQEAQSLDATQRASLKDAHEAMDTLMRLFKDLQEMGRSRSSSARVPTELGAEVRRIVSLLRGHSAMKQCHVEVIAPEPVTLSVFAVLIDQVLINLLLNAADATGGRGHIEVRLRRVKDEVRLEVHDDGEGLPAGMEAQLFMPFATTKPHGTGLGLVSVRECALAHGGRVEYTRSDLGGAAFSVCLPV